MSEFIKNMPKVELHMHIEGSMMPEMLLQLAEKNQVKLPYQTLEEVKSAYEFKDLTEFVDLYIQGTEVIQSADDFYELTVAYLNKCQEQNIMHTEVFCDIRTYTDRGLPAEMVLDGIESGFKKAAKDWQISGGMIPTFIRHLGVEKAAEDWLFYQQHTQRFLAIGLAAIEVGYPASLFKEIFSEVNELGMPIVAHAGEEGSAEYIWSAIKDAKVSRIDHGIRSLDDPELIAYLQQTQIPLTVCPCSNISLHVFDHMQQHVIKKMLDLGLNVTINSDDPAHFGAYLTENMMAVKQHCGVNDDDLLRMTHNAIDASFAGAERKHNMHHILDQFEAQHVQ
ncbi:adenosine deaminase [Marinicella sp. S1101]|uniref:adenosine deaminase n=1 Tax=Marinicella marina TaxID=2996016 RepID=UPI002260D0A9|nr:adenosine deaminase [Marinicella marina]MCX7554982.1 adenosine deaminase [Marinicella marina]MDJ1141592.1 adenosine deaminase [Marinicella marina]